MLTRFLLRSRPAFIAFAALLLCSPNNGQAQDILKELEQAEPEAGTTPPGHNHEHAGAPASKQKATSPQDADHTAHKHTASPTKKKNGGHEHAKSGAKGRKHAGSHDASHTGAATHGDQHQMRGFLGPYPI